VGTVRKPSCVDDRTWAALPPCARGEAVARMAWLVLKGQLPLEAFDAALDGMIHDESDPELDPLPPWETVRIACDALPGPSRGPGGSPRRTAAHLARAADGAVRASLEIGFDEASARDVVEQACPPLRPEQLARTVEAVMRHVRECVAESSAIADMDGDGLHEADAHALPIVPPAPAPPYRPWLESGYDPYGLPHLDD